MASSAAPVLAHLFGDQVQVGDDLHFLGRFHRVESIEPYSHPTVPGAVGVAHGPDGFTITLFMQQRYDVATRTTKTWRRVPCRECHGAGYVPHPRYGSTSCPEPEIVCPECRGECDYLAEFERYYVEEQERAHDSDGGRP